MTLSWPAAGAMGSPTAGYVSAFYAFDPQGSAAERLDGAGNVLGSYAFDAFGSRTGTDSTSDPFAGFGGQWGYYADSESGLSLLGHRYYDSGTGRFLTRDPIGYAGGINLYSYTANNSVNHADPDGEAPAPDADDIKTWANTLMAVIAMGNNTGAILKPYQEAARPPAASGPQQPAGPDRSGESGPESDPLVEVENSLDAMGDDFPNNYMPKVISNEDTMDRDNRCYRRLG